MRLFVAVTPPAAVLRAVASLPRREVAGVRWTTPDEWHITLRFLGEVGDPATVVAALDGADLPPASAALGPRVTTLGRGVLVVPVAGLDALAAAVVAATADVGLPPDPRPFRGHLTLARARRGASLRGLAGGRLSAAFPVGEVCLVCSRPGPEGPGYEGLHTFVLGGP